MIGLRLIATCFLLACMATPPASHALAAEQHNLTWEWTASEQKRIAFNAKRASKKDDGYWDYQFKNISSRTNISAELAIEGFYYIETALATFSKISGLSFSKLTYGQIIFILHDKPADFKKAIGNANENNIAHKFIANENGKIDAEFHVLANQNRSKTTFGALVSLSDLQYALGFGLATYFTGKTPVPEFLSHGVATFFSGWDMRVDSYSATTFAVKYGSSDLLLRNLLKDASFMPTLTALVGLKADDFTGNNKEKNTALALCYIDFLFSMHGKKYRSLMSKMCAAVEKDGAGHDYTQTLLDEKIHKKMLLDWRQHICRVASRCLMPDQYPLEIAGSLPKQVSLHRDGNYGYRPNLLLTPMSTGGYTVAWHDPNSHGIKLQICDDDNKTLSTLAPDFLKDARSLLGCAHTGKNNTYVIAYSKDHAVGGKNFAFHLCGINADGSKIFDKLIFGDRPPTENGSKGEPGAAGTGRVVYNEATGMVGYYLAHQQRWPDGVRHQGGYIGSLQPNGSNITNANGWFFSHNFDQRLISSGSSFYALAHGDSYPRALGFSRWNISANGLSSQFNVEYFKIPGKGGDNRTDTLTGGVVEVNKGKHFAVVFTSSHDRKSKDVCATLFDDKGQIVQNKWLTNYAEDKKATFPRIAQYNQHVLIAWEECSGNSASMRLMLMSADFNQVFINKTFSNVELPTLYDLVNLTDGSIAWAVPVNGKLVINRIHLHDKLENELFTLFSTRPNFDA